MTFGEQISNFTNYGTFNYQFDEAGNLILNPSSSIFQQSYLSMNLTNFVYDQTKILNFYDPSFQEFIKPQATSSAIIPTELQDYINNIAKENEDLRGQLDEVISATSDAARTVSDEQGIKDIILQLRIALGQGTTEADFYITFPYLPISDEDKAMGTNTIEEMLPNAPQLIQPAPNIEFSHSGSSSNTNETTSSTTSPKEVLVVTKVKPYLSNTWSSGLKQYKVYDPRAKKNVIVVKDISTGYFVDRKTGIYYSLPSQYQ